MSQDWRHRHLAALINPTPIEQPFVDLIHLVEDWGDQHGDDYVLNRALPHLADALNHMVNADLGRLDGGSLCAHVDQILEQHRITRNEGEN